MPVFKLPKDIVFPLPDFAEPSGLLAVGGDLSIPRLLAAYKAGIFPWYSEDEPILWWAPSPRLVLFPDEFHLSRRLARTLKKKYFSITANSAFEQVIKKCASVRRQTVEGTWIVPNMQKAYCRLHELGFARSIECWQDEKLVGGLYGVAMGKVFFGESMFSIKKDASKIALATLIHHADDFDLKMIDCQITTPHLLNFGAREILGSHFRTLLKRYIISEKAPKKWRLKL